LRGSVGEREGRERGREIVVQEVEERRGEEQKG